MQSFSRPATLTIRHRVRARLYQALLATVLLVSGLCLAPAAQAQETDIVRGDVQAELRDKAWYLSARVDYQLNRQMLDALQNGIRLTFSLEVEVNESRNWLPDSEVTTLQRDYELSWQPLSRGYLVRDTISNEQTTHTTLFAALHALGTISGLPLIEASLLDPEAHHEIRLRALLNQQRLPGPLRMLAFWNDDFSLESDWHQWPLEE
ncbi:MAG: DUF4390 domain-containing protein [Gammaproteobacteria bacterium]|nr:DUF4390 domain-containing protein [Gammaproteobacteria bacterium]